MSQPRYYAAWRNAFCSCYPKFQTCLIYLLLCKCHSLVGLQLKPCILTHPTLFPSATPPPSETPSLTSNQATFVRGIKPNSAFTFHLSMADEAPIKNPMHAPCVNNSTQAVCFTKLRVACRRETSALPSPDKGTLHARHHRPPGHSAKRVMDSHQFDMIPGHLYAAT